MYQLVFEGEAGSERYEICTQAVLLTERKIQVAEWSDVVALQRKLKEVGTPSQQEKGITLYDLKEDAVIFLERTERELLLEFIAQPMWRAHVLERVMATHDWVKKLDEFDMTRAAR